MRCSICDYTNDKSLRTTFYSQNYNSTTDNRIILDKRTAKPICLDCAKSIKSAFFKRNRGKGL